MTEQAGNARRPPYISAPSAHVEVVTEFGTLKLSHEEAVQVLTEYMTARTLKQAMYHLDMAKGPAPEIGGYSNMLNGAVGSKAPLNDALRKDYAGNSVWHRP